MEHIRFVGLDIHRSGFRSQWQRVDAAGRWKISARLPMTLMPSKSYATVRAFRQAAGVLL